MRLARWVTLLLVILAVVAAAEIVSISAGYTRVTTAIKELGLRLEDFRLDEEAGPRITFRLALENATPLDISLMDVNLSVYLNDEYMGSNYGPFTEKEVAVFGETSIGFDIPIHESYLPELEAATESGVFAWQVRGAANIAFPYGFREKRMLIDIDERWSGGDG